MKIQKRNRFYELKARGEQESIPDIVTSMLQVFSVNVYAFLDPGATFPFVTTLVAWKFDLLPDFFYLTLFGLYPNG